MREKMPRWLQPIPQREPQFWSYVRWSSNPQEWGDSERRQNEAAINCAKKLNVALVDRYRNRLDDAEHRLRDMFALSVEQFRDRLQKPQPKRRDRVVVRIVIGRNEAKATES